MTNPTFLAFGETTISADWYFERLRLWRDEQLKASDWTQIADSVCDKTAWATYRQALRDLPSQSTNPADLVFPVAP
jgi:hypothetical protein